MLPTDQLTVWRAWCAQLRDLHLYNVSYALSQGSLISRDGMLSLLSIVFVLACSARNESAMSLKLNQSGSGLVLDLFQLSSGPFLENKRNYTLDRAVGSCELGPF
jgi:hypothetical protein